MNYAVTNSSTPIVEGLFPQQMRRACFISDRSFCDFPDRWRSTSTAEKQSSPELCFMEDCHTGIADRP